jgi:hypothetical protein
LPPNLFDLSSLTMPSGPIQLPDLQNILASIMPQVEQEGTYCLYVFFFFFF